MDARPSSAASLGPSITRALERSRLHRDAALMRLIAPSSRHEWRLSTDSAKGQDPIHPSRSPLFGPISSTDHRAEPVPSPLRSRRRPDPSRRAQASKRPAPSAPRSTASNPPPTPTRWFLGSGTLAGPLHGGAMKTCSPCFEQSATEDQVEPYLDRAIAEKQKIMGFGTANTR